MLYTHIKGVDEMKECHFENCINYEDGRCQDSEMRKVCIDMSEKILCQDEVRKQDGDKQRV